MKQEDRDLLARDLCARLPYGVRVRVTQISTGFSKDETLFYNRMYSLDNPDIIVKPYLHPMSSMTEEEKEDLLNYVVGKEGAKYFQILTNGSIDSIDAKVQDAERLSLHWINFDKETTSRYIGWLLKYHFDFHNLIPKGLALPAPKGMYNIK